MGDAAESIFDFNTQNKESNNNFKGKDVKDNILETYTDEIIIGLCGPIGTDIHLVANNFERILKDKYNYECYKIKLSELIKVYCSDTKFDDTEKDLFNIKKKLIDGGNELRQKYNNSILADLAINEITVKRELNKEGTEDKGYKSKRICYIIDSIKNKDELEIFRLIYRNIFYFVGVFSPLEVRKQNLENEGMSRDQVFKLVDEDSGQDINFGQQVSDTFVESDFFLRFDDNTKSSLEKKIKRFLDLMFSTDINTPTDHESAMYFAFAAAGNSACLSRQVGASITNSSGKIISIGWNDVPKFEGGVYKNSDFNTNREDDMRCYNYKEGKCFNDSEKFSISEKIVDDLISNKLISKDKKKEASLIVRKSRIKDLIEFSRAIHAEMLAIISLSLNNENGIKGGRLYCTTYPCHNCAKHILAAGIKDVYYIEPFRKSLAIKLHGNEITEDETKSNQLRFLIYEGVSPKRYLEFFTMSPGTRKKEGKKISYSPIESKPKKSLSLQAIPILEKKITEYLKEKNLIKDK